MSRMPLIALLGSLVLGAVAGATVSVVLSPVGGGASGDDGDLARRVQSLEAALERSRDTADDRKRQLGHLADRLVETELQLGAARRRLDALEGGGATEPGGPSQPIRPGPGLPGGPDGPGVVVPSPGGPVQVVPADPEARKKAVERWRNVSRLRALSEDERWKQIQEELRLSVNQVDEIKAALEARSEALEGAMEETEVDVGGFKGSIRTVTDPELQREAQEAFDTRVERALDAEQREQWKEGGYAQAVGAGSSRGAVTVISTGTLRVGGEKPTTDPAADDR